MTEELGNPDSYRIKYRCQNCRRIIIHPTAFMLNQVRDSRWKCGHCGLEIDISIRVKKVKKLGVKKGK